MNTEWLRRRYGFCFVMVLLAMSGCGGDLPESATDERVHVSFITVAPVKLGVTEDLPGRVMAVRTAEIRPQVSGIVQHRLFEQGAEIKVGQPLFQINPAPFKADVQMAAAALQRAEAALLRARVQATRMESLVQVDAVSRQVYDDAVSQRDQAAADVAQAHATLARRQLDLKFATVDAPISGRIDQARITEGALVGATDSTPMATIQQLDQVYVDVRQPASMLEPLREVLKTEEADHHDGLPARILRSNGEAYPMTGSILFSGVNVDAGTGDVLLRILVDNPQRELLPGMFVRARIPRSSYGNALMAPQQAVVHIGSAARVWIVDAKDKVHAAPVQLGELVNRQYHIRAGLSAGQKVVVEGLERLAEGTEVEPHAWPAAEPTDAAAAH
ncbi:membrane fusion protein, multidrug efflux system [Burkholderia sp. GAS332]|uniref:efflux RND transporter periplasmic adaptor subunit n=1 Tax=Paraburkholderia sp. TaxID=1926495 RepID=UPI00092B8FB3|nr:membrane fusion protein, multidrug efflux system [Burkholderia sp. GAS332]